MKECGCIDRGNATQLVQVRAAWGERLSKTEGKGERIPERERGRENGRERERGREIE